MDYEQDSSLIVITDKNKRKKNLNLTQTTNQGS